MASRDLTRIPEEQNGSAIRATGTPDGPKLHSINIDPRDPSHIYIGISTGGVFESMNGGRDWRPLNKGCGADILSDPDAADGHDPHCVHAASVDAGSSLPAEPLRHLPHGTT